MITLVLATTNTGKQAEMQAFFAEAGLACVEVVLPATLPAVDETGSTFAENARLKAVATAKTFSPMPQTYVVAEDSGFSVPVLAGSYGLAPFPGVESNRWLTPERQQALLGEKMFATRQDALDESVYALLAEKSIPLPTSASYTSALCVVLAGCIEPVFETEGQLPLHIVPQDTPAGCHGFGYDRIVTPASPLSASFSPVRPTLSHLTTAEKNCLSHRGQALQQLAVWLQHN